MAKIDLHVHSLYSEHPSDWFLKRLGAMESYTDPGFIQRTALERGMDFVTLTDHNRIDGCLKLKERYKNTITGVEVTTYFPEDECKIHLLLFGLSPEQFDCVQELRSNIYSLRDYVLSERIAYSVAHATYSINKKLTASHLERLILLFDVFEGINGARDGFFNRSWTGILSRLEPHHIETLQLRHGIAPASDTAWIKGFTGGSDDHAGLFIGKTYTEVEAATPDEVLEAIRTKRCRAAGRHNDYRTLAFAIYKIALDFTAQKNLRKSPSRLISEQLLGSSNFSLAQELRYEAFRASYRANPLASQMFEAVEEVRKLKPADIDERLDIVYAKLAEASDVFFRRVVSSLEVNLREADLGGLMMGLSSALPGVFLTLPFMSSQKHLHENRSLIAEISASLGLEPASAERRILWFTDTVNELNGVAETIKEMARLSRPEGVTVVSAGDNLPPETIALPTFFSTTLPGYESIKVNFPSVLKSIELLYRQQPTEIIISTPGPVGLIGLLCAQLLNLPVSGIYHTDFSAQAGRITGDALLAGLIEKATRWFYGQMDCIKVPTSEYRRLLESRGFDHDKLQVLTKHVDPEIFKPRPQAVSELRRSLDLPEGFNLLYAGRMSKDKSLDFLADVYRQLASRRSDVNLLMAGDGPDLENLKNALSDLPNVRFAGRVERSQLPQWYSLADLFVFPSTTDTFGMVVLEAQSCGLPAIVSDQGGPKEIILPGVSGFILPETNASVWLETIDSLIELKQNNLLEFKQMQRAARSQAIERYNLSAALKSYFTPQPSARKIA